MIKFRFIGCKSSFKIYYTNVSFYSLKYVAKFLKLYFCIKLHVFEIGIFPTNEKLDEITSQILSQNSLFFFPQNNFSVLYLILELVRSENTKDFFYLIENNTSKIAIIEPKLNGNPCPS